MAQSWLWVSQITDKKDLSIDISECYVLPNVLRYHFVLVFSKTALQRSTMLDHVIPFALPKNFYEKHNGLHYHPLLTEKVNVVFLFDFECKEW